MENTTSFETLKTALPDDVKDQKLNLGSLAMDPTLSVQQLAGTLVASALASRNARVIREIVAEFGPKLRAEALTAAKTAASVMAMNNVDCRATHPVGGNYPNLPARLRMDVMARPGVNNVDFELWSLAVSAINGCGMCMESRENVVRHGGVSAERCRPRCASPRWCMPSRRR